MADEKRLIDANVLYKEVTEKYRDVVTGRYPFNIVAYDMARLIESTVTVDAVEVVRCKVCDWYREDGGICVNPHCSKSYYGCRVRQDHFCSYGERKKE